jgi:hypothetical protein
MDVDDMQEPDEIDEATQPRDFGLKPRRPFQRWTPEQKSRYHRFVLALGVMPSLKRKMKRMRKRQGEGRTNSARRAMQIMPQELPKERGQNK